MRIKRIEIIGFKSFCDRTVMTFHDPITGVVGPNGCGKSNVVDAIRWCMGEQSAKHLRGQSMADVIFNGSDKRGPAGMAQVSLTFEDVGFSHENLEVARSQSSALKEAALAGAGPGVTGGEPEGEGDLAAAPPGEETTEDPVQTPELSNEVPESSDEVDDEELRILTDSPPSIDYSQYSEVTITRRLFRDGSSGYFLNQTPCRLRDITDFFLGTGVGTKAYSIIEQGRIGMIVSSRPQERRYLIEEAAGVTKFKSKKKAAERKLEQTRANLLRVTDIVSELGKRMGTLKRQAQKAERYRTYRGEVRDIEMWKASHRFLEIAVEQYSLSQSLDSRREELENARTEFEVRDAQIVAERAELSIEERRLAALQEQIYELENRIGLAESKVEYQRKEADELDQRAASAQGEIRGLEGQRSQAEIELAAHKEELSLFGSRMEQATENARERQEAFDVARQALVSAQQKLDQARRLVSERRSELARAESQSQAGVRRREDTNRRLVRVREEIASVEERVATVEKVTKTLGDDLAELKQMRLDLGQQASDLTQRKSELEEQAESSEEEVETLRSELHRKKSRLVSLREIQERYEGFARGTRAVMQNRSSVEEDGGTIRGLVADVVNAPQHLEVAVEAVLGDRLGGVLVDDHAVGRRAVQYLKDAAAGRTTFVPALASPSEMGVDGTVASVSPSDATGVIGEMTELVRFEEGFDTVARALLRDTVVVDTLDTALRLHAEGLKKLLVTLDGDMVDSAGVVTGGCRESEGSSVLAQKREIRELEEITSGLDLGLAEASQRFANTKSELASTIKQLETVRGQAHDRELVLTGKEKEQNAAQGELGRMRERMNRMGSEKLELEETVATLDREAEELSQKMTSLRALIGEGESAQLGLVSEVSEGQVQSEALSSALTHARVEVAQLGEKRASLEAAVLRGENSCRDLGERIRKLQESIADDGKRATELRSESAEIAGRLDTERLQRNEGASALSEGRGAYETRVVDLEVKDHETRQLRQKSERLSSELSSVEVKLESLAINRQHLEASVYERYAVQLKREVGDYHLRKAVGPEDEERLLDRKKLIERMGADINLTAIEEFEEVSKRHDFLASQKEDLETAVDQLEKAIAKINRTSKKLFRDTFEAINENFSRMFPRLFRGGRAMLQLTGGDDFDAADAGVEIMAQPPGKKNSSVDQLSGGEKALTAVALLFAIFLIKPSPFCLLDEVDAPLDEANVDRYNECLREMIDRSQFIVITHNKRTMGIVDRLYGVTMEEPGVSKLVSVNLQRMGEGGEGGAGDKAAAA